MPDATIIASHMDAVNHATISRAGLRDFLRKHGKDGRVLIPEDGECLEFRERNRGMTKSF